jgi:hypothetical protein
MLLLLGGLLIIWWQLHKSSQFYFEWRATQYSSAAQFGKQVADIVMEVTDDNASEGRAKAQTDRNRAKEEQGGQTDQISPQNQQSSSHPVQSSRRLVG